MSIGPLVEDDTGQAQLSGHREASLRVHWLVIFLLQNKVREDSLSLVEGVSESVLVGLTMVFTHAKDFGHGFCVINHHVPVFLNFFLG